MQERDLAFLLNPLCLSLALSLLSRSLLRLGCAEVYQNTEGGSLTCLLGELDEAILFPAHANGRALALHSERLLALRPPLLYCSSF